MINKEKEDTILGMKKDYKRILVSFDMDGTLIRNTNSMELVGGLNGHEKDINDVFERIKGSEKLDWVKGDVIMAGYMTGVRVKDIDRWFSTHARVINGLKQLLTALRESNVESILVTSGPKDVAECFMQRYPFEAVYGSEYEKKNGILTGKITSHIMHHGGKYGCIIRYCRDHDLNPEQTIVVGDSYSDIEVFRKCRKSIALNGDDYIKAYASTAYNTEDIRCLLPQILQWKYEG